MEIDCSHYVILVCDPGHASYTALWEELGLKFVRNTFLGSDSELACPWFGFLPDSHHSIFQVLQQLFLKLTALPADSCFFPSGGHSARRYPLFSATALLTPCSHWEPVVVGIDTTPK